MTDQTRSDPDADYPRRYQGLDDGRTVLVDVDPVFAVVHLNERLHDAVPRFMRGFLHDDGQGDVAFVPYSDASISIPLDEGWMSGVEEDARRMLHERLLDELQEATHFHNPRQPGMRAGLFAAMPVLHEMVDEAQAKLTTNPTLGIENPQNIDGFVHSLVAIELVVRILIARCGVDHDEALLRFVRDSTLYIDKRCTYRELLGVSTEAAR